MAGGRGTRLQSVAKDIPKPMAPVLGKPVLQYQIESLKSSDIMDIILIIGYLGEAIQEYFGDGRDFGVNIEYIVEDVPLGTAGSLFYLKEKVKEDFILLFGDLVLDVDWNRFMAFHKDCKAAITLYGHPNSHPADSDVIVTDKNGKVIKIEAKNEDRQFYYNNFVNAGLYCIAPKLLSHIAAPQKIDLEKTIISDQIVKGRVYAYRASEYVKDMGTPDRLERVLSDIRRGIVSARNLRNKQKAVFLDRDGTINVLKGFLNKTEEFEMFPRVEEAIKKINMSAYLAIVITNQPVIARGECTFSELENIHKKMQTKLGDAGAYVDDIFYCPHHPQKGFYGEVPELKVKCKCRKPEIGLLECAADKYNIDLSRSWLIGDTTTDIQTGINAGMKTILVKTGEAGLDGKYKISSDYEADTLLDAVDVILQK